VKWDLDNELVMEGEMTKRIMKKIIELQREGSL